MSRVDSISISKLDNGYTIYVSYLLSDSKKFCKTEEEVIEKVATALSNNTAEFLEVKTVRVEPKEG